MVGVSFCLGCDPRTSREGDLKIFKDEVVRGPVLEGISSLAVICE
jgi:hypothetical protein